MNRELHATVDFLNKRKEDRINTMKMTKRVRKTGRQERRVKKSRGMKKKRSATVRRVVSRSPMRKAGRKARRSTKKGKRSSR